MIHLKLNSVFLMAVEEDEDEDDESPSADSKRKSDSYDDQSNSAKRQRTVLNPQQRQLFHDSFEKSPKPCKEVM